jgi:hypothetical protein
MTKKTIALAALFSLISSEAFTSTSVNRAHQSEFFTFEAQASFGREVGGEDSNRGSQWSTTMAQVFSELGQSFDVLAVKNKDLFSPLAKSAADPTKIGNSQLNKGSFTFKIHLPGQRQEDSQVTITCNTTDGVATNPKNVGFWTKLHQTAHTVFEKAGFEAPMIVRSSLLKVGNEGFGLLTIRGFDLESTAWLKFRDSKRSKALVDTLSTVLASSAIHKAGGLLSSTTTSGDKLLSERGLEPRWTPNSVSHPSCETDLMAKSSCTLTATRERWFKEEGDGPWVNLILQVSFKAGFKTERDAAIKALQEMLQKAKLD